MALANVLGYGSNDAFNRSLECEKTSRHIDELCPTMNVENIAQFITLPPYADVSCSSPAGTLIHGGCLSVCL